MNLDNTLQDWGGAYKELCDIIAEQVPEVKHIDLYYGQEQAIDSDGNWLPFRAPAVFIAFNADAVNDLGDLSQQIEMSITVYLAFETVQDSNMGSLGQARALEFIGLLRKLNKALHNTRGIHFSPLSRTGLNRVEAPPYMILYTQTYRCVMIDNTSAPQWDHVDLSAMPVEVASPADPPEVWPDPPFNIPG